jgi:hypothetical protein
MNQDAGPVRSKSAVFRSLHHLRHVWAPMHFPASRRSLALSRMVLLTVYQQSRPLDETRLTGPGDRSPLTGGGDDV